MDRQSVTSHRYVLPSCHRRLPSSEYRSVDIRHSLLLFALLTSSDRLVGILSISERDIEDRRQQEFAQDHAWVRESLANYRSIKKICTRDFSHLGSIARKTSRNTVETTSRYRSNTNRNRIAFVSVFLVGHCQVRCTVRRMVTEDRHRLALTRA